MLTCTPEARKILDESERLWVKWVALGSNAEQMPDKVVLYACIACKTALTAHEYSVCQECRGKPPKQNTPQRRSLSYSWPPKNLPHKQHHQPTE